MEQKIKLSKKEPTEQRDQSTLPKSEENHTHRHGSVLQHSKLKDLEKGYFCWSFRDAILDIPQTHASEKNDQTN